MFHEYLIAYYYQISEKSGSYMLRIGGILLRNEQGCRTGLKKGHNDQTLYPPIMHLILVVILAGSYR